MISGIMYTNDIKGALQTFGALSVPEIKAKLAQRNVNLDDIQILDGIDLLIRRKEIQRSDISGKYVKIYLY